MAIKRKRFFLISLVIIICVTALIAVRPYILQRAKTALQQKLQSLNKSGYTVQYDSIYIDWKNNFIVVDKLLIKKNEYDTTCLHPEFITADKVRADGISIAYLIFKKELNFESVRFENPHIVKRQHSHFLQDSAVHEKKEFTFRCAKVTLVSAHVEYMDNASCKLIADVSATVELSSLAITFTPGKPLDLTLGIIRLDSALVHLPQLFYTLTVNKFKIDFTKGIGDLDSLMLEPHYSKLAFGRMKGRESDRIEGVIPFLKVTGFSMQYKDSVTVKVRNMSIQMYARVFRDKRLPLKDTYKPLPLQLIRDLPFGLHVDTVEVIKSFVEYEEYAEGGDTPGKIYFDDIQALIYNIDNDGSRSDGKTIMLARASVMGQGDLRIKTEFPWNATQKCLVEGSLRELTIPKVNSMMEAAANIKAESGKLESLTFKFVYNGTRSDGELELNYKNLKLISYMDEEKLKKKEGRKAKRNRRPIYGKEKKDNLKTLILNAFVIRKNMGEKVSEEKRTGTILFYRDTSRSVFNYWWKSLLSGLRSAFNMDKHNEKENQKNRNKSKK